MNPVLVLCEIRFAKKYKHTYRVAVTKFSEQFFGISTGPKLLEV